MSTSFVNRRIEIATRGWHESKAEGTEMEGISVDITVEILQRTCPFQTRHTAFLLTERCEKRLHVLLKCAAITEHRPQSAENRIA